MNAINATTSPAMLALLDHASRWNLNYALAIHEGMSPFYARQFADGVC